MKPTWEHDCPSCKYLGSIDQTRGHADWYECGESVIARFGDEGSQYWSLPKDVVFDDRYVSGTYREMTALARFMLSPKLSRWDCTACGEKYWDVKGQACSCPNCGMA